ncbi:MAG: NYN domain-containing protein [Thermoanaerobaculia bacterium]
MSSTEIARRAVVYVDGFNLYFGLVEQGWRKFLWLNLSEFGSSILRDGQQLSRVKYFTSRISGPVEKKKRQDAYLTATRPLAAVEIHEGAYRADPIICKKCTIQVTCPDCRAPWVDCHEKMTDVKIATQMFCDAMRADVDDLVLVSGDSDQVPAIKEIRRRFKKRVIVCFPPKRYSADLAHAADDSYFADEANYRKSQFPQVVDLPGGFTVVKPDYWSGQQR